MATLATLSSLVFLQLSSRLLTFALNQSLIRLTTPKAYGTASIQFELLSSTILFLGREGVRNTLLRSGGKHDQGRDLAWLPLLIGTPVSIISLGLYLLSAHDEVAEQPFFHPALAVYTCSALIELASEPGHNYSMTHNMTTLRVRAEGLGMTLKTMTTFLTLVISTSLAKDFALLAYSLGQLAYSITLIATYISTLGSAPWSRYLPSLSSDNSLLWLALTMTSQSIVKHFLTEGDRLILSLFAQLEDQGGYALAVNYGSLIARIVFQPIEETLRVHFSKVLPAVRSQKEAEKLIKLAHTTLTDLLRLQIAFSFFILTFGCAYLDPLLNILLPGRYLTTSAPQILKAYVFYIPFLSINGGLEAFVSSASSSRDLNTQSSYMIGFSLVYITAAVSFYSLQCGDSSLIYANVVNLSGRIFYALQFSRNYFPSSFPAVHKALLPSHLLIIQSFASGVVLWFWLPGTFSPDVVSLSELARNLSLGGCLAIGYLAVWWLGEGRDVVMRMVDVAKAKQE